MLDAYNLTTYLNFMIHFFTTWFWISVIWLRNKILCRLFLFPHLKLVLLHQYCLALHHLLHSLLLAHPRYSLLLLCLHELCLCCQCFTNFRFVAEWGACAQPIRQAPCIIDGWGYRSWRYASQNWLLIRCCPIVLVFGNTQCCYAYRFWTCWPLR